MEITQRDLQYKFNLNVTLFPEVEKHSKLDPSLFYTD